MANIALDIGSKHIKIAWRASKKDIQTAQVPMPEGVINEGRILDPDTFIDILKSLRQEYKISARDAVLVLNDELALVLHTNMPAENPEELQLALPAEFSDFITQNPDSYVYDYVVEEDWKQLTKIMKI